jgi:hypothetical protein
MDADHGTEYLNVPVYPFSRRKHLRKKHLTSPVQEPLKYRQEVTPQMKYLFDGVKEFNTRDFMEHRELI